MATLILKGLPSEVKRPRLVFAIKSLFRKSRLNVEFWITSCSDMPGSNFKEVTISFSNPDEAFAAAEVLHNFEYVSTTGAFKLSAYVDTQPQVGNNIRPPIRRRSRSPIQHKSRSPIPRAAPRASYERYSPQNRSPRYSRERYGSRSPQREMYKVDLELELLRKKCELIEEERRLLLEQRRLRMAQEAASSLEDNEVHLRRSERPISPPPKRAEKKVRTRPKPRKKDLSGRPIYIKNENRLPRFIMPCKFLVREMQKYIPKFPEKKIKKQFKDFIYLKIRTRIAAAIQDKQHYMRPKEIFDLYRSVYPKETDEALVKIAIEGFEQSLRQPNNKLFNANAVEPTSHTMAGPKWFIDTAGEGESSNVNLQNNMAVITVADDSDLNDAEDWNIDGEGWIDIDIN